jgi:leucyl/phenylalanyl-tRNA--protein transferase
MHFLDDDIVFPELDLAVEDGLLAVGGDLSVERLLLAYRSGIFPWYGEDEPILWWSPDPRMVLFPSKLKISKSLRKSIGSKSFTVTFNKNFPDVIQHCASVKRKDQPGTWITREMMHAYIELQKIGMARSIEVWNDDKLVGGLYGVDLNEKKIFCGESMFSLEPDASKVALYHLAEELKKNDYLLIDCQIHTLHLEKLGAEEISRNEYLEYLSYDPSDKKP